MRNAAVAALAAFIALSASGSAEPKNQPADDDQSAGSSQNITPDAAVRRSQQNQFGRIAPLKQFFGGREVRSIDGAGNSRRDPLLGSAFSRLQRLGPASYADGVSSMAGPLRKGAREISNIVVAQGPRSIPNTYVTSDYLWQWGQFLDHDISLTDGVLDGGPQGRDFDIKVPTGDPFFDPQGVGGKVITFNRALFDPATGFGPDNPREQQNELTSWIDASQVYGSNAQRALALRRNDGSGMLKTSRGDLLPFNANNLPNANGPAPDPTKLFIAGDVRSNEQVGLAAMHTLFVREHNRLARIIGLVLPWYSDEEIYQTARRLVGAEMQAITYNEFLPALIGAGALPPYRGYDPAGDPTTFSEFSAAAYRFGHSAINAQLLRLDRRGRASSGGALPLRAAFFTAPSILTKRSDIDPILRGLAAQESQTIDAKIVDDLRNFLFGPPGAGGLDLASLNIQRGRDHGLPSYNDARAAMGLARVRDFDEISADPAVQRALFDAYGTVDDIDLWVGGLAEDADAANGSQLGPLFRKILAHQFTLLRDCDRFWYERDLTRAEQKLVEKMTLSRIIRANTGIRGELQKNVFYVR